jgi:uncharacterized protein
MTLVDTNAFIGPWPFLPVPARSGAELLDHLRTAGVRKALVSHLGSVFQPEPMTPNRALFASVRRHAFLVPIPILNPLLATWEDHLQECADTVRLHGVRIAPAFHNYSLRHRRLEALMSRLDDLRVPLLLQVRFEEERNRYFGLRVHATPERDIDAFLGRFPGEGIVCIGLYKGELERLSARHRAFAADISFAEHLTTVETLLRSIPVRRLLFGSGTPVLSVAAQVAKVRDATLPAAQRKLVAGGNAARIFRLGGA